MEKRVSYTLMPFEEPGLFDVSEEEMNKLNEIHYGILINTIENAEGFPAAHIIDDMTKQIVEIPLKNVKIEE